MSTYDQIVAETAEWKQKAQSFEQKAQSFEQKAQSFEQKAQSFEQKAQSFEQELKSVKQQTIRTILKLHENDFKPEKIADFTDQSLAFVKEIIERKEDLKDLIK